MEKKLVDKVEPIGNVVEHAGFKKTGDAIERAGNRIENLGENSADWVSNITDQFAGFEEKAKNLIKGKPIAVLVTALAAGYFVKRIFDSRDTKSSKGMKAARS